MPVGTAASLETSSLEPPPPPRRVAGCGRRKGKRATGDRAVADCRALEQAGGVLARSRPSGGGRISPCDPIPSGREPGSVSKTFRRTKYGNTRPSRAEAHPRGEWAPIRETDRPDFADEPFARARCKARSSTYAGRLASARRRGGHRDRRLVLSATGGQPVVLGSQVA